MSRFDPHEQPDAREERDPWDEYAARANEVSAHDRWAEWAQLGYDTPVGRAATAPLPHSRVGIVSTVLTIISGLGIAVTFVGATILAMQNPALPEDDPQLLAVGCSIIASLLLAMVGGGLGLFGLFQRDRNRLFAILGCVFSAVQIFGGVGLILIGLIFG